MVELATARKKEKNGKGPKGEVSMELRDKIVREILFSSVIRE